MFYPYPLHTGDRIGLVAPSSPITSDRLSQCIQTVSSFGLRIVLGNSCRQSLHGYLAGADEIRASDINSMFASPHIRGIFCLRGGYGGTQLMDLLDYSMIRKNPKIFVGYSDITSLHLAFQALSNLVTFHGPMVSSNMVDDFDSYTRQSFFHTIAMPSKLLFRNPQTSPWKVLVPGCANGRILGGCLSLVSPSIGTFYQPNFSGNILFLEDIDESLPRCDKLMQHLAHSCILDQVNGILLGNFVGCTNPNDPNYTIYDYFKDFFSTYNKPVIFGVQSGHAKPMGTLPLGALCTIDTRNTCIQFDFC